MGITDIRFEVEPPNRSKDFTNTSIVRNNNKCILCRRCVAVCKHIQKVEAIDVTMRGMNAHITNAFDRPTEDSECILCGQCITVCPTGALREKRNIDGVKDCNYIDTYHLLITPKEEYKPEANNFAVTKGA